MQFLTKWTWLCENLIFISVYPSFYSLTRRTNLKKNGKLSESSLKLLKYFRIRKEELPFGEINVIQNQEMLSFKTNSLWQNWIFYSILFSFCSKKRFSRVSFDRGLRNKKKTTILKLMKLSYQWTINIIKLDFGEKRTG